MTEDQLAMQVLCKVLHGMGWVELRDSDAPSGYLVIDGSIDLDAEETALVKGVLDYRGG